jgi:hypothetical protein
MNPSLVRSAGNLAFDGEDLEELVLRKGFKPG